MKLHLVIGWHYVQTKSLIGNGGYWAYSPRSAKVLLVDLEKNPAFELYAKLSGISLTVAAEGYQGIAQPLCDKTLKTISLGRNVSDPSWSRYSNQLSISKPT